MRAAVFQGLNQKLCVEAIPVPVPKSDEVIIKVGRCGICGSDLHMTEDPAFNVPRGMVLGHEFAGEVVEIGKEVESLSKGDRVAVVPMKGCGHCTACLSGEPGSCADVELIGGGYGEYAVASARQLVRLPLSASVSDGALVEPLAVALHGVMRSELGPGDKVVILGAGPIGLATAFWARRMGARQVILTDLNAFQQDRAMEIGATDFVTGDEDHVSQADRRMGGKADIVFECVGVPGMIAQAIEHVRPKGKVLIQGLCTRPDSFVPFRAINKECTLQFSNFFKTQEFETSLDILSMGTVEPRALITGTIGLDELPNAFEALRHRTTQCKVQIAP
jgi:(R,R)-butanediol dehydrogenase / meso-butanediol dehydrogenase / diacetyl reductase